MSAQVGWLSKLYTKLLTNILKDLQKWRMKLFFLLITYTYRFSHLLAKLCREHFKDGVRSSWGYLPQVRTTRSFYRGGKDFAILTTPGSLGGCHRGHWAHIQTIAKTRTFPRAASGMLTQRFTDICGILPFDFCEAEQNLNGNNVCFIWLEWAQRTLGERISYRFWVLNRC